MKKAFSTIAVGGLLLVTLLGCAKAHVAAPTATALPSPSATAVNVRLETAEPAVTPQIPAAFTVPDADAEDDGDRILGHCLCITDELPCAVDLDGDGALRILDLEADPGEDEYPRWTIVLMENGRASRFRTDIPCDMPYDLWVGDLDEDGRYEIFFHGDTASNDYLIYAFRSDMSLLFFEPDERAVRWGDEGQSNVFAGYIEGFEDGHIVIEGVVDMLGTHWGVRNYAIGDDGVIGPVSSVWTFDEGDDRFLTVAKALKVYAACVRQDPVEAFVLEPGEKLYPLASDGCERMWFKTGTGKTGVLLLTPDENDMWLIDGTPEAEYFDDLPYAG